MVDGEYITYRNIDPKVRKMIMIGLSFAMLVACLDATIVSTCGSVIAADLGGLSMFSWMISAYMLCETIMIPIAGKLSDLYGRKLLFLIGLGFFAAGSVSAGFSFCIEMFILARVLQGIGAGIVIPVVTAAVADLYAPEERGKIQGILGAVFGIGSGLGPLMGGYITEYIAWNWMFFINVPFVLIAVALTLKEFPAPIHKSEPHIDGKGIAFLSLFILDLLLLFEWAGTKFDWISINSFLMIMIGLILLALFIVTERRAVEPIIAPHLLKNRTVTMSSLYMLILGIAMMGAMMYTSMFAINVLGLTTLETGAYSLMLVFGMMITANLSGQLVNRTGYRLWLILGPSVMSVGLVMTSFLTIGSDLWYYALCQLIFGLGVGCLMSVVMTAVQNNSKESEVGMTTSAVNLIKTMGATVGTSLFTLAINNKLTMELESRLPGDIFNKIPHDTSVLAFMDEYATYAHEILLSFANSVDFAFLLAGIIVLSLIVIGVIFKTGDREAPGDDAERM